MFDAFLCGVESFLHAGSYKTLHGVFHAGRESSGLLRGVPACGNWGVSGRVDPDLREPFAGHL